MGWGLVTARLACGLVASNPLSVWSGEGLAASLPASAAVMGLSHPIPSHMQQALWGCDHPEKWVCASQTGLAGSTGAGAAGLGSGPCARLVAWGPLVAGQAGMVPGAITPLSSWRVFRMVPGAVRGACFVLAALEHQN